MTQIKYLLKSTTFAAALLFLYGFGFISTGGNSSDKTITLNTASGYTSKTLIYKARGTEKDISVIALHGKSGRPGVPFMEELYDKLNRKGYTVFAPTMPWAKDKREGTFAQAMELIDKAIEKSGKQKVVVLGHSMGGMAVLQYGGRNPASQVIGIVTIATAHDPHIAKKILEVTADSVKKAKQMVAEGNGKEKATFKDVNSGRSSSFPATAEYYVSFYDPQSLPSLKIEIPKIKLPVYWVVGSGDKLTKILRLKDLYGLLPDNAKNHYLEAAGSHKSVVGNSANDIAKWLDKL